MDRWKRNSLQLLDNNRASQYFGRFFNIINNNNNNNHSKTSDQESPIPPPPPSCPSPAWKLSDSFVSEEITPRRRKASAPRSRPRPMSYNGPLFIDENKRHSSSYKAKVNSGKSAAAKATAAAVKQQRGSSSRCVTYVDKAACSC